MLRWLTGLVLAFVMLCSIGMWQIKKDFYAPNSLEEKIVVLVPRGASLNKVADKLQQEGVIKSPLLFVLAARFLEIDRGIKAGEYEFLPHVSPRDVLQQLAKGEVFYRRITLPEGLTTAQMLEIINSEPSLSDEITLDVKEGDILPETYSFAAGTSRNILLSQAMTAMQNVLDAAWLRNEHSSIKSKKDLLVLASIVEKETGLKHERASVASVFINRLNKGMKLQTDPTVIYALTMGQRDLGRSLFKKDLEIDSPYNTYRYFGLPPEPICNPGKDAIFAVINSADEDYIYFVATGGGGHNFAKTLSEHNTNVQTYRQKIKSHQ